MRIKINTYNRLMYVLKRATVKRNYWKGKVLAKELRLPFRVIPRYERIDRFTEKST